MDERSPVAEHERIAGLMDRVVQANRDLCAAQAELQEALGELEASGAFPEDADTCVSSWAAWACGVSRARAEQWVSSAVALRELPQIAAALAEGELSYDKVLPLVRFVTAETDAEWAEKARGMSVAQLHRRARRENRERERAKDDHEARRAYLYWDRERRWLNLEASLPADAGAALEQAISRRARQVAVDEDALDPQAARMADALVDLVTRAGPETSPRPVLVVHADAEVLLGGDRRGDRPALAETESGVQLTDEAVRRLACTASIRWVARSGGRAVGISAASPAVPPHLMRELWLRDGGCRFGGCSTTRYVEAHHLEPLAVGGPTHTGNLALLCSAHHRFLHDRGWTFSGEPYGELRFHDPTNTIVRVSVCDPP